MSHQSEPMERAKQFLGGGTHQGWVFGVCHNIARRSGWELWTVRLVAALALLTFTLASIGAYFVLGMLMDETRPRTQRRIRHWARHADRVVDTLWRGIKQFFDQPRAADSVANDDLARNP